jgi:hypothetical protein
MPALYVSSLPFKANEKFLQELISRHCEIESIELFADWVNPTYEPYAHVYIKTEDINKVVEVFDGIKIGHVHMRFHEKHN